MNYYIYLDDVRNDDTWFRQHLADSQQWRPCVVRSYNEIIQLLDAIRPQINDDNLLILDLDHDLGESENGYDETAPTGYDICRWIVETDFPDFCFHIHSLNTVGAENMRHLLTHYGYKEI